MATKKDRYVMTVRLQLDKPCASLLKDVLRQFAPVKDIHKLLNDPVFEKTEATIECVY